MLIQSEIQKARERLYFIEEDLAGKKRRIKLMAIAIEEQEALIAARREELKLIIWEKYNK